jgi:hypothetical protein
VELKHVPNQFPLYHTKILFRDFNAEVGTEDVFKPPNGSMSLHDNSYDNCGTAVNIKFVNVT